MTTLLEVMRDLIERGDLIPDIELPPGVWHEIKFSVFTTTDDRVYFDDESVVPREASEFGPNTRMVSLKLLERFRHRGFFVEGDDRVKQRIHRAIMRYAYRHANLKAGWDLLWAWSGLPEEEREIISPPVPGVTLRAMLELEDE